MLGLSVSSISLSSPSSSSRFSYSFLLPCIHCFFSKFAMETIQWDLIDLRLWHLVLTLSLPWWIIFYLRRRRQNEVCNRAFWCHFPSALLELTPTLSRPMSSLVDSMDASPSSGDCPTSGLWASMCSRANMMLSRVASYWPTKPTISSDSGSARLSRSGCWVAWATLRWIPGTWSPCCRRGLTVC